MERKINLINILYIYELISYIARIPSLFVRFPNWHIYSYPLYIHICVKVSINIFRESKTFEKKKLNYSPKYERSFLLGKIGRFKLKCVDVQKIMTRFLLRYFYTLHILIWKYEDLALNYTQHEFFDVSWRQLLRFEKGRWIIHTHIRANRGEMGLNSNLYVKFSFFFFF